MSNNELMSKILECEGGLTWEQRLDFLLKAVNDVSKSLNEAAQASKVLHMAMANHNELLTVIFYLISFHMYDDDDEKAKSSVKEFIAKFMSKDKGEDEETASS